MCRGLLFNWMPRCVLVLVGGFFAGENAGPRSCLAFNLFRGNRTAMPRRGSSGRASFNYVYIVFLMDWMYIHRKKFGNCLRGVSKDACPF